ncbi:MAG TPA: glycosyltransferase family 1 protein [Chloroflexota bacterium]
MRVGFLTYGLDRPLSGVGRVAVELGRELRRRDDVEIVFLTPYRQGPFVGEPGVRRQYLPGCRLLPGLMLLGGPLIALLARRLGLDLVHDPIGVSPFTLGRRAGRFRRVVTLHDAIAFEYPQGYPFLNNLLHRTYVPATLGNVDAVATDSEHARGALVRYLGLRPERLKVIPLGASGRFRPVQHGEARAVAARYGLEGPFVLYVGAYQARKNILALIEAFTTVRRARPDLRLALAGPSPWAYPALGERIERLGEEAVRVLGYVADPDLPALYSAASVYVLPSLYEGFGIPVLEAMACGTPVVCSTASSLPEVAGDAALLVDPHDPGAIAEAIRRVVTDPDLADDLRRRGLARAGGFTWARTAAEYAALYRALTDDQPQP